LFKHRTIPIQTSTSRMHERIYGYAIISSSNWSLRFEFMTLFSKLTRQMNGWAAYAICDSSSYCIIRCRCRPNTLATKLDHRFKGHQCRTNIEASTKLVIKATCAPNQSDMYDSIRHVQIWLAVHGESKRVNLGESQNPSEVSGCSWQ
jgi:hypothetical protein